MAWRRHARDSVNSQIPGYCIFPLVIAAFCSLLLQVIWLKAQLMLESIAQMQNSSTASISLCGVSASCVLAANSVRSRQVIFVCVGFTWATGASARDLGSAPVRAQHFFGPLTVPPKSQPARLEVAFMAELLPEDRKARLLGQHKPVHFRTLVTLWSVLWASMLP